MRCGILSPLRKCQAGSQCLDNLVFHATHGVCAGQRCSKSCLSYRSRTKPRCGLPDDAYCAPGTSGRPGLPPGSSAGLTAERLPEGDPWPRTCELATRPQAWHRCISSRSLKCRTGRIATQKAAASQCPAQCPPAAVKTADGPCCERPGQDRTSGFNTAHGLEAGCKSSRRQVLVLLPTAAGAPRLTRTHGLVPVPRLVTARSP